MIRVIPNWRVVLRRAWSVKFLIFAMLFTGAEAALPIFGASIFSPVTFALLTFFVVSGATLSRFVAQKGISDE